MSVALQVRRRHILSRRVRMSRRRAPPFAAPVPSPARRGSATQPYGGGPESTRRVERAHGCNRRSSSCCPDCGGRPDRKRDRAGLGFRFGASGRRPRSRPRDRGQRCGPRGVGARFQPRDRSASVHVPRPACGVSPRGQVPSGACPPGLSACALAQREPRSSVTTQVASPPKIPPAAGLNMIASPASWKSPRSRFAR